MDILYYSTYCKHSQKIIQFLSKGGLLDSINSYNIDKRRLDPKTNQIMIILDNGKEVLLPPNINSVPAMLLIKQNYQVVLGDDIIQHFEPAMKKKIANANFGNGEPLAYAIDNSNRGANIVSENFTYYDMSPEELSAKGEGGNRQMYNYVSANQDVNFIQTPPDSYKPDKIENGVTIDNLQEQRNSEIPNMNQQPQFKYNVSDF
jgi:hypothetical protein